MMSFEDMKKDLPQLTKRQYDIINFWYIRGYEDIKHVLGVYDITLHRQPKYECLGLQLIYLEQFIEQEKRKLIDEFEKYIKDTTRDNYQAQSLMFIDMIKEKY